jgi:hypothetical protein
MALQRFYAKIADGMVNYDHNLSDFNLSKTGTEEMWRPNPIPDFHII